MLCSGFTLCVKWVTVVGLKTSSAFAGRHVSFKNLKLWTDLRSHEYWTGLVSQNPSKWLGRSVSQFRERNRTWRIYGTIDLQGNIYKPNAILLTTNSLSVFDTKPISPGYQAVRWSENKHMRDDLAIQNPLKPSHGIKMRLLYTCNCWLKSFTCRISVSHSGGYEEFCLLGYDAV
jgi:hypothetical protein